MATPPLNPLVEKIRALHPGAYDDMDDAALTKAVLAKYPQYSDLAAPPMPKVPNIDMQTDPRAEVLNEMGQNAMAPGSLVSPRFQSEHPGQSAAMLGAGVAAGVAPAATVAALPALKQGAVSAVKSIPTIAAMEGINWARKNLPGGKYIPPGAEWLPVFMGGKSGEAAPAEAGAEAETAATAKAPAAEPVSAPKVTPKAVQQQVEDALGTPPVPKIEPGKPIYQRPGAPKLNNDVPPLTPVESSALKGYHYDPATKQFTAQTTDGSLYQYGNVDPDLVKSFENADSKGKAWQAIRNDADAVLLKKNYGNGWILNKPRTGTVDPNAAEGEDLSPLLKKSIERFKRAQGKANATD